MLYFLLARIIAIGYPINKHITVFNIAYMNDDIPKDCVIYVETDADAENELHNSIRKHFDVVALYLPNTLNINKLYNDFIVGYGGFYSNLIDSSLEVKAFSNLNFIFAIFKFKYRIGRIKLNMMDKMVNQEVERLCSKLFLPSMSQRTKAFIAHNYLATTVEYWLKKDANPLEKSYTVF